MDKDNESEFGTIDQTPLPYWKNQADQTNGPKVFSPFPKANDEQSDLPQPRAVSVRELFSGEGLSSEVANRFDAFRQVLLTGQV